MRTSLISLIITVPVLTLYHSVPAQTVTGPSMVFVSGGQFEMGDHHNYVDPAHPSDETPIHTVSISSLYVGKYDITVQQYCDYLNSALSQSLIRIDNGIVYAVGGSDVFFQTRQADQYSRIGYAGGTFSVLDNRGDHPVTSVLWHGAAAYANWLSTQQGYQACYNTSTWVCDFTKSGYRLPTEAEWEYAARGGQYTPYYNFPWGNDITMSKANFPSSGDPYESGALPWTTPAGFYNGSLRRKADFGWPGSQDTYQTSDGSNGYGLSDMAGNVWQWCNDWYGQDYYSTSPSQDPTGPTTGTPMPDGKPYRVLRGGNWYNGDGADPGHARVSNRDPAYYRGPQDPNHPYYHVGFRVVRRASATSGASTQTVGLFVNDGRAWNGYTLFAPKHHGSTYLINNQGQLVHSWAGSKYEPGQSVYLLENGHLLRSCMVRGQLSSGGGEGGRTEEYDWDGNLVWQFNYSTAQYSQHHDIKPLPNGNILMLVVEKKTYSEALAAGFNPTQLQSSQSQGFMLPDSVVEINPTRPSGGTVVWQWHVWDHLIQDFDSSKANYGNVAAHPELISTAGDGKQLHFFWNHMNSIYYNAALDQIVLSVRGNSEAWVIDHTTTTEQAAGHTGGRYGKGGDLLYRWGNPVTYKSGTANDQKLYQQHDVQWIEPGNPGAGNFITFNNGLGRNYSTADEWTPPVDAAGNYTVPDGPAYGPKDFTWSYKANPPSALYADAISSAQRLPNGNTLICDGTHGTFLEVTHGGETVWKYVNPVVLTGPLTQGAAIPADPARAGEFMNGVFRVRRYPPDHPGLAGRDLTPRGTVEVNGYRHNLYFPHIASDGTWCTEIALINTSAAQTVTGILRPFTNDGRQLEARQIALAPHARREITVGNELAGAGQIGYAVFESDSQNVVGYTKFYVPGQCRAAVPATATTASGDLYLSHLASNDVWWTGISLVNTTAAGRDLTIQFDNGESRSVTLGALSHSAFLVRSLFGNIPQPDIHSAVLKDAQGIIGLELFGSAAQLDGIPLASDASTAVYYPHIAADFPWWTGVLAFNPSDSISELVITPYNSDGRPLVALSRSLPGKSQYVGTSTALGLPADAAWLQIEATKPILGFELFGTQDGNVLAGFAGTGIRSKNGVFAKKERVGWTGLALVNLESEAATITLTAYDDSGSVVATQMMSLGAHAKTSRYASEFFQQDIGGATYFTYSSDRDLAGFQLNGSADGTMLDTLPIR